MPAAPISPATVRDAPPASSRTEPRHWGVLVAVAALVVDRQRPAETLRNFDQRSQLGLADGECVQPDESGKFWHFKVKVSRGTELHRKGNVQVSFQKPAAKLAEVVMAKATHADAQAHDAADLLKGNQRKAPKQSAPQGQRLTRHRRGRQPRDHR